MVAKGERSSILRLPNTYGVGERITEYHLNLLKGEDNRKDHKLGENVRRLNLIPRLRRLAKSGGV